MTIFDDYPPINLVSKSITSENGFIIICDALNCVYNYIFIIIIN